ncbi:MAG: GNAT family N-acetyltransferase [Acidimicrobiia bacterium]
MLFPTWTKPLKGGQREVIQIRPATVDDQAFLETMFAVAVDWHANPLRPVAEIMSEPGLAKYVADFPKNGDYGFVAHTNGTPLGATWYRYFNTDEPSYGFVDENTPELILGLVSEARGQGLGSRLIEMLIDAARSKELPALSLSVDNANPAMRIYRRLGFVVVDEKSSEDGSITHSTMLLKLNP